MKTEKFLRQALFYTILVLPFITGIDIAVNSTLSLGATLALAVLLVIIGVISAFALKGAIFNPAHLMAYSGMIACYYSVYGMLLDQAGVFNTTNKMVPMLVAGALMVLNLFIALVESFFLIKEKVIDRISELPFGRVLLSLVLFVPIIYSAYTNEFVFQAAKTPFVFGLVCSGFFLAWVTGAVNHKLLGKKKSIAEIVLRGWGDQYSDS
jgi:hypothetical protein